LTIPFIDLKKQYLSIKKEIDASITRVLESGNFILGENVRKFEEEFAQYCNAKFGVGVASGTDAIFLALLACGVKKGDEVITVPNTATPTVLAIWYTGAIPVFVDIDAETYNIDVSKIKKVMTKKTKAILPVHLYGQPADMGSIIDLAKDHNLRLVEDACQAHGAEYKGMKTGSFGDAGCFSFYPTKNLGCFGDGGMVLTSDQKIAQRVKALRVYGQKEGSGYHSFIKGFNSRLDELQAAILRVKLEKLDEWNDKRRKNVKLYNNLLENADLVRPTEAECCKHVYHLYVIRVRNRDKLQRYLLSKDIHALVHYPVPVHLQKAFSNLELPEGSFLVTERYSKEILSLPMFPELTEEQINEVSTAVKGFQTS